MSAVTNAAVPSVRQTTLYSPTATNPPTVASRYYGSAVATSADGSRSVVGESGTTGIGGEVTVYSCTASGCTTSASLNALATRTVSITQISITGKKATATTSSAHGFIPGEKITITGTGNTSFNVTNKEISDVTNNTISFYANSSDLAATSVSGTGVVDLAPSASGFGAAVDISDNGNLVLVGAPNFDVTYYQYTNYSTGSGASVNRRFGRAYLFEYISGAWALAKVFDRAVPTDLERYGTAVAISGDGSVSIITSYKNSGSVSNTAEVHINTPNPSASPGPSGTPVIYSSWVLQQTINTTTGADVDISNNGNVIVLAGDAATVGGFSSAGNAYIYTRASGTWTLTKTLARTDISGQLNQTNYNFGWAVAVSDDGNTVGTLSYQQNDVYIYRYSAGAWGTPVNINPANAGSRDKETIALSANGNVAMIGMPGDQVGCYASAGSIAFMEFSGGVWAQNGNLRSSPTIGSGNGFGRSIAISEDGSSFAISGAPYESSNGLYAVGSVTVFSSFLSNTETTAPTLTLSQGCTNTYSSITTILQSDPTSSNSIKFTLTADESIDSSTISAADFTITNGTYSSTTCLSTYCIITVAATAPGTVNIDLSGSFSVSDTQGNAATTAGGTDRSVTYDNQAPTLTSSTPANNGTGVTLTSNIVLNFSEAVTFQPSTYMTLYRNRLTGGATSVETYSSVSTRVTGSGTSTITIDPTSDLLAGYNYYLVVNTDALKDVAGNLFAGIAANTLNFSTTTDSTAPTLTSSSPADNATGFAIASNLVLTFNEDVYAGAGISITNKALASNVATLTTSSAHGLTVGTQIVVSGVDTTFNGSFTVASVPSSTTFTYSKTATNVTSAAVSPNGTVAAVSIFLKKVSDNSIVESYATNSSQLTFSTNTLTINPTADLAYLTDYYLEVGNTAVRDNSSNYYAGISGSTTLNFRSAPDTVAPTVVTLNPADNLTTVGVNQNLVLTFSEVVNQGTGSISIKLTSDNTTFESIPVSDARITGWGTNTITINPDGTFLGSVSYYVNIPSGAILDTAGNSYAGITSATAWNFTVLDSTPPVLNSITTNSTGTQVILTYNENLASTATYLPISSGTGQQFDLKLDGVSVKSRLTATVTVSGAQLTLNLTPAINPGEVILLTYTDSSNTGDIQDVALNDAPSFTNQSVTNAVIPKVTNVTSSTVDGTKSPGDTISIQVVFSGVVTVTGSPKLLLETGATDRLADYASGSEIGRAHV